MPRETKRRKQPLRIERIQEDRQLGDLAAGDLQDLDAPRLQAARRVGLVLGERRAAIDLAKPDEPRPAAGGRAGLQHPRRDVVGSLYPELVGWHRLVSIVVQQPDQNIHVVALEGVNIPLEEARGVGVERPRFARVRQLGQRGAGPAATRC